MSKTNNYEIKYKLLKKRINLTQTKVKHLTDSLREAEEKAAFWEEQSRACSSSRGELLKDNFENKKRVAGLEKRLAKYETHIAKLCELFGVDDIEKLLPYLQERLLMRELAALESEKSLSAEKHDSKEVSIEYSSTDDIELPDKYKARKFNM